LRKGQVFALPADFVHRVSAAFRFPTSAFIRNAPDGRTIAFLFSASWRLCVFARHFFSGKLSRRAEPERSGAPRRAD
jgi:hypothetical protein